MVAAITNFSAAVTYLQQVYNSDKKFKSVCKESQAFYRERKICILNDFARYEYLFSENYLRLQESGALGYYPDLGHVEANQIYIDGLLSGQSFQDTCLQVSRVFDRMVGESKDDPTGSNRLISGYEKKVIQVYNDFGAGCLDIIRTNFGNPAETSSQIDKHQVKLMKTVRKMLVKQVPKFWQQGIDWAEINIQQAKKKEEYQKPDIYIPPNQAAIDALIERNLGYIKGMTEDAKKSILSELTEGMLRGEGIDQLVKRLEPYIEAGKGKGQSRAEMIARSEVMYGLNQGAITRYKKDGIEKVQWLAGPDDRACEICLGNDGKVFPINDAPELPFHPNCLLPDTRCITAGDVVSGLRAWYDGPVFEISTSNGSQIAITPNHMFLTPRGFCAAQFLREGDDIINCSGFERIISENPDDHQTPTRIEDIFNSLIKSSGMCAGAVPTSPEYLHSDAGFTNGNIDIIFPDCFLGADLEPLFQKHSSGGNFDPACPHKTNLFSTRPLYKFLFSAAGASDGGMSGTRQSEPVFRARGSHPGIHSFTSISGSDPIQYQDACDNIPGNVQPISETVNRFTGPESVNNVRIINSNMDPFIGDGDIVGNEYPGDGFVSTSKFDPNFLNAYPGLVEIDYISDISIRKYSGYVYDLQTVSTLYIGSSVLLSNCRCTWTPYFDDNSNWVDEWSGKYQDSDIEHYAVYDDDGNLIESGSGTSTQVEIQGDTKDKTVIHNHPGTNRADFSNGDLKYAFSHDVKEMVVVTPTGSRCSISRPSSGWPDPAEVEPAWKEVKSAHKDQMVQISKDVAYGKISESDALVKMQELLQPAFYNKLGLTEVRL